VGGSGGFATGGGSADGGSDGTTCTEDRGCEDGDPCTRGSCVGTVCEQISTADDGDPCTIDVCDADGFVSHTWAAEDFDACTQDFCDPNGAVSHVWLADDGNACTDDYCDPVAGPQHYPTNVDDGDVCTLDWCDPAFGVQHQGTDVEDGNACTFDYCDAVQGPSHLPIDCAAPDSCGTAACDPDIGCIIVPPGCVSGDGCCGDGCSAVNDADCCTNLAPLAVGAKSAGGVGDYGPAQLNNGITGADCKQFTWVKNDENPGAGAYFEYDFMQPVTIGSIYVDTVNGLNGDACNPSGRNLKGAIVQYWTGSTWATSTSFDNRHDDFALTLPNPVTTTKLRLFDVTADDGNGNTLIYEWYVYPPGACAP
jgi:hypothetical protein